jgi:hypothetical protein
MMLELANPFKKGGTCKAVGKLNGLMVKKAKEGKQKRGEWNEKDELEKVIICNVVNGCSCFDVCGYVSS